MNTRGATPTTNRAVQVLRWFFGIYFVAVGIMHFVLPAGLPQQMAWMYDLSSGQHLLAGIAEILGGLGLILPRLTGTAPRLTALAAGGLALVMVSAAIWHISRGEGTMIVGNLLMATAMTYVAFKEWRATKA
ncbi:MAG: DoxX family protein [Trueperaceae bacterium]|nr:DoxX family protein [Trueperaceae bacterium]